MNVKKLLIRITLWWGIIADLFETVRMIFPQIFIATTGANIPLNNDFRFALLYGAPVMFGWAAMLFWADRKPVKRSGILLCLVPVIAGYIIVEIIGIRIGMLDTVKTIPTFVLQSVLLVLSVTSYCLARTLRKG